LSRTLPSRLPRTHWILIWSASILAPLNLYSDLISSRIEVYVTTKEPSASLSWNKASIWSLRLDFYYFHTLACLLMWGTLSDERTGLSFTIAADPRQRSHSWVRVRWDLRPHLLSQILDFPFRRILRLAGLRSDLISIWVSSYITSGRTDREHQLYPASMDTLPCNGLVSRIHLHGSVFADPFPSNGYTRHNIVVRVLNYVIKNYAMKTWRSGGLPPLLFTTTLDRADWSASNPGRFTSRERDPGIRCIGGWMSPTPVPDVE
jgi:hypothetical protein